LFSEKQKARSAAKAFFHGLGGLQGPGGHSGFLPGHVQGPARAADFWGGRGL